MSNLEFLSNLPGIPEELRLALRESWEEKIKEITKETELKLRKELAEKYEYDKNFMVESIEKFLSEGLTKELKDLEKEKKKFFNKNKELEEKLKKELEDLKKYKEDLQKKEKEREKENLLLKKHVLNKTNKKLEEFVSFASSKLEEEVKELNEDKKHEKMKNEKMRKDLMKANKKIKEVYEERINKLEEFVLKQLTKELKEFNEDKKLLEKRRVELEVEGLKKINEAKRMFIEKASSIVDSIVTKEMTNELKQLKEDIKHAREVDFGRRLFEAFVAEFMSSNLFEGSQVNKLMKKLNESKNQIESLQQKLMEERNELKKVKKLMENMQREKIIAELVAPLSVKQKKVMCNLLEGVSTPNLKDAFKKYLPGVLNEVKENNNIVNKKETLNENVSNEVNLNNHSVVTGDRNISVFEEDEVKLDNSVIELKKLAGL